MRSVRSIRTPRLAVLGVLLAVALTGCSTPQQPPSTTPPTGPNPTSELRELTDAEAISWLDATIPATLERNALAGASVAIVSGGEVLATRGYGAADLGGPNPAAGKPAGTGTATPVDPAQTLFRVGSISKVVTATAVMQLADDGRIDLDADIQQYLDEPLPLRYQPITMRNLLTHTAGFEERARGLVTTSPPQHTLRDEVFVDPPEQVFQPGTTPAYSNYSFTLAGYIVERVAGQPFAEYADRAIFEPAGMRTATFDQPVEGVATGYAQVTAPPMGFDYLSTLPAGSMSASADDMARFMIAVRDGTLIEQSSWDQMITPALSAETLGGLATGPQTGLAWWLDDTAGERKASHGGDTRDFHSELAIFPDRDTGIYVSFNTTGEGTAIARKELIDGFADRFVERRADAVAAVAAPATETSAAHARAAAKSYIPSRASFSTWLAAATRFTAANITAYADGTITVPGQSTTGGVPKHFQEVATTDDAWVWQEVGGTTRIAMDVENGVVTKVGISPAITLIPADPTWALLTPVFTAVAIGAAIALLAWPIGALVRRRYGASIRDWPRTHKTVRLLTYLGLAAIFGASAAWTVVLTLSGVVPVPGWLARVAQLVTLLPALAMIPAVAQVVFTIRHRPGFWAMAANIAIVLILAGFTWACWASGLFLWSTSY